MPSARREVFPLADDPLWYKDAIVYELHVRAFRDSDGDGIGDFVGLTQKLDYLQDLGVTALWLLPFYPSPLRDDGYDIADYKGVHPAYGTLKDFKTFLREAHRRGLRVITELVMNHTSDAHPWFQRARRAKSGSRWRDFYVWSDTPERYKETRIIFQDFEPSNWTYDRVAGAYFWHRFYSHQPDLNFDNPEVRKEMFSALDYWLGIGVDGLRLDAVPYLFEREGTNCENLPETHAFLRELRAHVDGKFKNKMFLAEANQWPEDAAAYFGQGDECHMNFHFPLMPRMFMALQMEDRTPIIDILEQTPPIAENCQWATFLRNHDELTLEMVTDEERDYMWRTYAQDARMRINLGIRRRLAPLLGNNFRTIELLHALLLSLPGTPVLYYGDEIGMGDNIYLGDRNSLRTPMQWSADRNAGFSRASPHQLYLPVIAEPEYHYESVNVEAQLANPNSLLWWMKRTMSLSRRSKALGRGTLQFLHPENRKVLAFLRRHEEEVVLVVANLSRHVEWVELDLGEFKGLTPVEMFGQTEFPYIGDRPFFLSLAPHAYHWFALRKTVAPAAPLSVADPGVELATLTVAGQWTEVFRNAAKVRLERALPDYLRRCRWFQGKGRKIQSVAILGVLNLASEGGPCIATARVDYVEGEPETYALPLVFAPQEQEELLFRRAPSAAVLARVETEEGRGVLYDGLWDPAFCTRLLKDLVEQRRIEDDPELWVFSSTRGFRAELRGAGGALEPANVKTEQSNTSVAYGGRFILKFFRRLDEGINPDLEIGRFLTEKASFSHVPRFAGALEYRHERGATRTLAVLHDFVQNQGDAWNYTLEVLRQFYEAALARQDRLIFTLNKSLVELASQPLATEVQEFIGPFLSRVDLLGRRTAELHRALASGTDDPAFVPEPFTTLYQRAIYQSLRNTSRRVLPLLRKAAPHLADASRADAERVLAREEEIRNRFRLVTSRKINAMRIRIHGDYHLGQVLFTGSDFVILDFEGEPLLPLGARRLKRSPLRDVAGMLRSFQYAAHAALIAVEKEESRREDVRRLLEQASSTWQAAVGAAFLRAYLQGMEGAQLLPASADELRILLDAYILEKAIYEVGYELGSRPDWVGIPLRGILQVLESVK